MASSLSSPSFFSVLLFLSLHACCLLAQPQLINLPSQRSNDQSTASGSHLCPSNGEPPSCPVSCFSPDPVCGADGVTYWCGCADALCSGTTVAKLGYCEVGNGGNGAFSGQVLLLVHIVWLIVLGFLVILGLF
ncbi:hypothetical protein AMTRI_Chr06g177620 [Amborella trichopoda]|uniref:Kazal-like domain-containing protein n=1 Tax=Amborella trichopoda TaxID=13333 RepID=W1PZL0_AMBTC|nr:uncharacterized protein LOC18441853 [Amborella trichopoda]ERN13609.1 hypothetical protein AMTR_s00049p00062970 [Amborella trichopoda]|eukprot:XP_006852142.1 uncharacterized protein LOC18441853 [Amborella trichopoda]